MAEVRDGFAETGQGARFDGQTAVLLDVFRVGDQSALKISSAVTASVEDARLRMPDGIALTTWNDQASILRDRIRTLVVNGLQGLALVFITLALFLHVRLAFWVAFSIPLALLGAIWMMPVLDVSVNLLSLFCFIMVLGIIVDDGTLVAENIYRKKQEGLSGYEAAVQGTNEVSIPVIFGALTTCAAFLPMLGLPGMTGKIMRTFPLTVVPALLFSLVESQLALPAQLKHVLAQGEKVEGAIARRWKSIQSVCTNGLERVVRDHYTPLLHRGAALYRDERDSVWHGRSGRRSRNARNEYVVSVRVRNGRARRCCGQRQPRSGGLHPATSGGRRNHVGGCASSRAGALSGGAAHVEDDVRGAYADLA